MGILSGIQPSGNLHIGNYFGMMRPAIALQAEREAFYFIADYHALTSLQGPKALRENSRRVALDFLACGNVGLGRSLHLSGVDGGRHFDLRSDVVSVGKDQKQRIEVTRDIATKINETFGEVFKLPEPRIQSSTETVPGIDGQKMSKSYGNTINIFGDEKEIGKRVMSIVTDSTAVEAAKDPHSSTIFQLFSLFASAEETAAMREAYRRGGAGYGDFKKQLFTKLWEFFQPMRKRRAEILARPGYIDEILERGAARANEVAGQVMTRVRAAVGL